MQREEDFLNALLADPSNDTTRLVYADWLEEQVGTDAADKLEFLRTTVELAQGASRGKKKKRKERLKQLAATLTSDWLAIVSRLPIESCAEKRKRKPLRFEFLCDKRWEDLQTTADHTIRFCAGCQNQVYYCDSLDEARVHAMRKHCVAIDLGVKRKQHDLEIDLERVTMGLVDHRWEDKDNDANDE